jgi:hypothetical protein
MTPHNKAQILEIIKFIEAHQSKCYNLNCPYTKRYDFKLSIVHKL